MKPLPLLIVIALWGCGVKADDFVLKPIDTLQYEVCPKCGGCVPARVSNPFYKEGNPDHRDTAFIPNGMLWVCRNGLPGGGWAQRVDLDKSFTLGLRKNKKVIVWCRKVKKENK